MALLHTFKSSLFLSSEIRCSQLLHSTLQSSFLQIYGPSVSSLHLENGRRYYRKFHRRPVKINPAKEDEGKMLLGDYVDQTAASVDKEVIQETRRLSKLMQSTSSASSDATPDPKKVEQLLLNNEINRIPIECSSEDDGNKILHQDPVIQKALKSIKYEHFHKASSQFRPLLSNCCSRKLRHRHDLVLLEGFKLIQEALSAGLLPVATFYSRKNLLLKMMPKAMELEQKVERLNSMNIFSMPYGKMKTWSSVVKGQGVLGVFRLSDVKTAFKKRQHLHNDHISKSSPLGGHVTLILDSVREPGNVGALIRTAAGAGVDKVVLTKGCCDPWESKALRAGCGGHLSVEVCESVLWSRIYTTVPRYPAVYLADVGNSDREPLRPEEEEEEECSPDSEAGMNNRNRNEKVMKRVFKSLPSDEKNATRRAGRLDGEEDEIDQTSFDELEEFFGSYIEVQEDGSEYVIDNSFLDGEHLKQFADAEMPVKLYNEVNFFPRNTWQSQPVVLVVGGETGLTAEAKKFAHDNYGAKINIPLHRSVDSLNTSVASGVIIYEMWKQLQKVQELTHSVTSKQALETASE